MQENQRVESLSNWYYEKQLNFDKHLIYFRYKTLEPHIQGPRGLELGSAQGYMTKYLINHFAELTTVDGSSHLLAAIPESPKLKKIHSLFENFESDIKFNTIIMEHILEHIENPGLLLERAKNWLAPNGKILLGVPNAHSIHRLVAVKMGLLENPCQLNERDIAVGHRRVYTSESLNKDILASGLKVIEMNGVFFKPLSNQQIDDHWTEEMIMGFYELGKDFKEHAAELSAVCMAE